MASAIEEILKKLVSMERRIARLEAELKLPPLPAPGHAAQPGTSAPGTERTAATQATVPAGAQPMPPTGGAPVAAAPRPVALALVGGRAASAAAAAPAYDAVTVRTTPPVEQPSALPAVEQPAPACATPAPAPRQEASTDDDMPFPDLSELDAKLEVKRGPAEKIDVRAYLEDFPRISKRIQELWQTPECEAYLTTLIIDTRGNRQGFPTGVMDELLYLARLARALVILNVGGDLWDAYDQVGDRR